MSRLLVALIAGLLLFGLIEGSGNASWNRLGKEADPNACWHNAVKDCWCCEGREDEESCNTFCIERQHLRVGLCGYNDQLKKQCCVCLN
ncbi:hypothetical protein AAVH_17874 [Aphelenchoides avenae]|nr:hypothetical protein AAVH_42418 [Aphelenchus avenae]KAH7714736.1 hypothetical protein AAVH_17874 [Aphelenchus avenae]